MAPRNLAEPQYGNATLTDAEAEAACGPIAAAGFARAYGRNPTAREALDIATQESLISLQTGMKGPEAERALLGRLGIEAEHTGADWDRAQSTLAGGSPVIISTPGHYFLAEQYDPQRGYYVGNTGLALRQGSDWMTQQQMEGLMGASNGMLYGPPGAGGQGGSNMVGGDPLINPIIDFIQKKRQQGMDDGQISTLLGQNGASDAEINQAFAALDAPARPGTQGATDWVGPPAGVPVRGFGSTTTDNGDGTRTVTTYQDGAPVQVSVQRQSPIIQDGKTVGYNWINVDTYSPKTSAPPSAMDTWRMTGGMTGAEQANAAQAAQNHADTLRQQAIANQLARDQLNWSIQQFGMTAERLAEQDRLNREWDEIKWQTQRPNIEAQTESARAGAWNTLHQAPYQFERTQAVAERAQSLAEQKTAIDYARTGDPLAYLSAVSGSAPPGLNGGEIWQGVRRSVPTLATGGGAYAGAPAWSSAMAGSGQDADTFLRSRGYGYAEPLAGPPSTNALAPFAAPKAPARLGAVMSGGGLTAPGRFPAGTISVPGAQAQRNLSPYEAATLRSTAEYQGIPGADWDAAVARARAANGPRLSGRGYAGVGVRRYG